MQRETVVDEYDDSGVAGEDDYNRSSLSNNVKKRKNKKNPKKK